MDIQTKLTELGLPLAYANHYAGTISLIDLEEAKKISASLAHYGVKIGKASELKWYTCNDLELNNILNRLQYCRNNNIPVVDENGNNMDYVFSSKRFKVIYPEADLTQVVSDVNCDKKVIDSEFLKTLEMNVNVGLTEDTYDRYRDLENKLTLVMQALYGDANVTAEMSNNLIKLISSNGESNDSKILFAVLVYNQNRSREEIEAINNTINTVLESLNQGGSLNL